MSHTEDFEEQEFVFIAIEDEAGDKFPSIDERDIIFLTVDDLIEIHIQAINRYAPSESLLIRDKNLLESSVYAPQHTFDGQYVYRSIVEMAAVLMQSLASNHPFENGNKRVAFGACSIFLRINGFQLTLTQDAAVDLTLNVVQHRIDRQTLIRTLSDAIIPIS